MYTDLTHKSTTTKRWNVKETYMMITFLHSPWRRNIILEDCEKLDRYIVNPRATT